MNHPELIPHLFRTEYRKITAVLCKLFGIEHIEIAEDIASDTFLQAAETWSVKGLPPNPVAWLYTVAKNKAKDLFKHNAVFTNKVVRQLQQLSPATDEIEIDLSDENITDSTLQMLFAVCHPTIPADTKEKWESILQLYNQLLLIEYSPIAALNRTFALAKANGKKEAIMEAEKLQLSNYHLYHSLLGELYTGIDNKKAVNHFKTALSLARSASDKVLIIEKISGCEIKMNG